MHVIVTSVDFKLTNHAILMAVRVLSDFLYFCFKYVIQQLYDLNMNNFIKYLLDRSEIDL